MQVEKKDWFFGSPYIHPTGTDEGERKREKESEVKGKDQGFIDDIRDIEQGRGGKRELGPRVYF